jgi:hypothetical protein
MIHIRTLNNMLWGNYKENMDFKECVVRNDKNMEFKEYVVMNYKIWTLKQMLWGMIKM